MADLTNEEVRAFYDEYLKADSSVVNLDASSEAQIKAALRFAGNLYRRSIEQVVQQQVMATLTGIDNFNPEHHQGFTVVGLTVYGNQVGGMNLQRVVLPAANQDDDLTREHMRYMGSTLGFDADQITTQNVKQ